jgi:G3E family GTPase
VLTGFLGAGKTTLLNRLLAGEAGRVAVIVNEFGEVPIDGRLVVGAEDRLVTLANGCVCCTVRGDLAEAVAKLLEARRRWLFPLRFDRVVVETSGLASPGPVVQTFLLDARLAAETRFDGVITLVAAPGAEATLAAHPEARAQVAHADLMLLTHVDRADPAEVAAVKSALARANPAVPVHEAVRGDTPLAPLLDLRAHEARRWRLLPAEPDHRPDVGALAFETDQPVALHSLKLWLQHLANRRGQRVLRMKGIFRCVEVDGAVVVHAVHEWLELGPGAMPAPERSALVILGMDLDEAELRRGWEAVLAR